MPCPLVIRFTFCSVLWASVTAACAAEPSATQLIERASEAARRGQSKDAVRWATEAIAADPQLAGAYYIRGRERFRLGEIKESVSDFDRYVQLRPDVQARQWERGIALYYAQRYADGARQFEQYQTYHANDVENSAWRFMCVAASENVEKAKESLLPIQRDPRIPMMTIYDLFRGEADAQDVMDAVREGDATPQERAARKFYADLYIGLFLEATGDPKKSAEHMARAAAPHLRDNPHLNRYMWDVARVHHELRTTDPQKKHPTP